MTSPSEEGPPTGSFGELSEAECKQLLAQHTAGRVGFMVGDGPQILPVTYQYRTGSVIFRTSPYGPLAGLVRRTSVAFEIDGIDEQNKVRLERSGTGIRRGDGTRPPARIGLGDGPGALGGRRSESVHRNQAAQDQRPGGQVGFPGLTRALALMSRA
jgi:hypothetical protein